MQLFTGHSFQAFAGHLFRSNLKPAFRLVALLCAMLASHQLNAQQLVTYKEELSGAAGSLAVDSNRTVMDSAFFAPGDFPGADTTWSIYNMITFSVDETSITMPPDSFKVELTLRIYFTNGDGIYDSIASKVLNIDYRKTAAYNNKAIFYFNNARSVKIRVLAINVLSGTLATFLPLLKVENRMVINRVLSMNCTNDAVKTVTAIDSVSSKGILIASWGAANPAQEYDLEWTFIDQAALDAGWYNTSGVLDPEKIFRNNATRVSIVQTMYKIPMLYDGDGKIFFRVRGAQMAVNGQRYTTAWSSGYVAQGGLGQYTYTGHERKLNWQATTSFAEEGKRKSVVQYFDGTLRSRQTVTKDNITDTTIVAETFYDKQGRSVIEVLPAPSLTALIKYNTKYNVYGVDTEYTKNLYDTLYSPADYCSLAAPPMDSVSGASKYYSYNNQNKLVEFNKYIPQALEYPFTQVKYTQDNTGRISGQSGVSPVFKLGTGHETKYYYGTPEQSDLDALFGTEAGYASHYQKNMVRDANGQYSVSYIDMHGRTVATALAGKVPAGLQALSSKDSTTQTDALITRSNNVIKGNSIESVKGLIVTKAGPHTFTYKLNPESLKLLDKNNVEICYDCLYDLTITITDDCNNQNLPGQQPYVFRDSNMRVAPPIYDTLCTNKADTFATSFTITLPEGSYMIAKKLSLREDARNWYRDSLYAPHNTVKTKQQVIQEQLAAIRSQRTGCEQDAEPRYAYENYHEQMLMDMTPPYGQYAKWPVEADKNIMSIFAPLSNGKYLYQDVNYNITTGLNPASLSPNEFVQNFQPEWAEYLVRARHPERTLLAKYEAYTKSDHWDADFEATETYQQAYAKGYLNPTNNVAAPGSAFGNGNDSLFYGGANSDAKTSLNASLSVYKTVEGNNYSLWAMASALGHCDTRNQGCLDSFRTTTTNLFNAAVMCEGERDMAWRFFRNEYLRLKRKWINDNMGTVTLDEDASPVFMSEQYATDKGGDLFSTDLATAQQAAKDSMASVAAQTCTAYAVRWWEQLASCNYNATDSLKLIPRLIEICKRGSDSTHPFGASSIAPGNAYTFNSFDELIAHYNDSTGKPNDAACNAFLIDAPGPYNKPMALVNIPAYGKPDSCTCDKISSLYNQYQNAVGYSDFSDYVQQKLHTTITQNALDSLRNLCNGTINCRYMPSPVIIPPALQCSTGYDVCVDCNQVNSVYNQFKTSYPGIIPGYADTTAQQQQYNELFKKYMNNKLGFSKTTLEYLVFMDSCGVTNLSACDSLEVIANDFRNNYRSFESTMNPDTVHFGVTEVFKDNIKILKDHYSEIFKDGVAHVPTEVVAASPYDLNNIVIQKNDTLCVGNNFTIEAKVKGDSATHLVYPCRGINFIFWDENPQVCFSPTVTINTVDPNLNCGGGIFTCQYGNDTTNRLKYFKDLLEWTRIKMVFKNNNAEVYINDTLITSFGYTIPITKIRRYAFNIGSGFVDYVRIWDSTGKLTYVEEFEDCQQSPSNYPPEFACAPNCTTRFTSYFNQRQGTSYTYNQIDSVYFKKCGKHLDICGSSTADNLSKIVDDFVESKVTCIPEDWRIEYVGTSQYYDSTYWLGFIADGATTVPDSTRIVHPGGMAFSHRQPYAHSLTGKNFTVETRMRIPRADTSAFNPNLQMKVRTDSTYINVMFWQPGSGGSYWGPRLIGGAYDFEYPGFTTHVYPVPSLIREFQDWAVFKVEVINDSVHNVYFNDLLVLQLPFRGKINVLKSVSLFTGSLDIPEFKDINFDYIKIYDSEGNIIDYVGFDCQENCDERFKNYYNQIQNTSYSYSQIDSVYAANGLVLTVCNPDTSNVRCDQLEKYVDLYKQQYITPSSGYVDLDMRTFAGNKTPDEGPKGVFDINGKLLGNTVDSTATAIKESYVSIWNNSADNRAVGTLSLLQSGKFRLTLNPGKQAPCEGIIGQRYYQIDVIIDSLSHIGTSSGTYVDFGDSSYTFVNNLEVSANTTVKRSSSNSPASATYPNANFSYRYSVQHTYQNIATRSVTIYHSDHNGSITFDCGFSNCGWFNNVRNLRGYFPQDLYYISYHTTQDSTLNTFSRIRNFNTITSIQLIDVEGHSATTGFRNNRFQSFQSNKGLKRILLDNDGTLSRTQIRKIDEYLPDIVNNFPNLSDIQIRPFDTLFAGNLNFTLPQLRNLWIQNSWISPSFVLTTQKIDEIINQVAAGTQQNNGSLTILPYDATQRSPASDSAVAKLISMNWRLIGAGMNNDVTAATYPVNIIPDTSIVFSSFTDFINSKLNTKLNKQQIDSLYLARCGHKPDCCSAPDTSLPSNLLLCGKNEPSSPVLQLSDIYDPPCSDSSTLAYNKGTEVYNAYKDSLDQGFNKKYNAKCLSAAAIEQFTVRHEVSEYHYTLYYYDQAGNLIKTVPPAGVHPNRDSLWLLDVAQKRDAMLTKTPVHDLPTVYRYNSLNQVVSQQTPDGGKSSNWYDRLGRLAVSRNAKQQAESRYSYTLYDHLGRITEVGQKYQTTAMTNTLSRTPASLENWIYYNDGSNHYPAEMVTQTIYDVPGIDATACVESLRFTQKPHTLRNRVSYTRYYEKPSYYYNSTDARYYISPATFTTGIDYSYDIHGNVDTMRNLYGTVTYGPMAHHGYNACKTIAYTYDLISGKVNQVHYNPGQNDEFYHRYAYDAENRLTHVYTTDTKSFIGIEGLEDREAMYTYYRHGPLARTMLGQGVQGIDYAYTLQGWLKGVNSTNVYPYYDVGGDGTAGNTYNATDAYSYTLHYFDGDYKGINYTVSSPFAEPKAYFPSGEYRPLYNGNISSMAHSIPARFFYQLYNYQYDQLNRLVSMDMYRGLEPSTNKWSSLAISTLYKERYTYDPNGNITKVFRNGHLSANALMDSLRYFYKAGTNQLDYIRDRNNGSAAHSNNYGATADIKDQASGNYVYNAIGELNYDRISSIDSIKWNVYGKIQHIYKHAATYGTAATGLHYYYDPSGNRVGRAVLYNPSTSYNSYTWYVRDAQGNVLATYRTIGSDITTSTLKLIEHHMYGSSRLGIINRDMDVDQGKPNVVETSQANLGTGYLITFTKGNKLFELTNHLGNVLVTVTDVKTPTPKSGTPSQVGGYIANMVVATDYTPFGMIMQGRNYNSAAGEKYRYGFNGKEYDNSVKGTGNEIDYGERMYDPMGGRFWSVDPFSGKFPWLTPYNYASNNPIRFIDINGASTGDPPKKYIYDRLKVDLNKMPASHTLANGKARATTTRINGIRDNSAWYWDEVRKNNPSITWSKGNKYRLDNGISPVADNEFVTQFSAFEDFKGQTLHMHHMDKKNGMGIALPQELHIGKGYTQLWHKAGIASALFGAMMTLYQQTYGQDPLLAGEFVNKDWEENELMRANIGTGQNDYGSLIRFAAGNNSRTGSMRPGTVGIYYASQEDMATWQFFNLSEATPGSFITGGWGSFYQNADEASKALNKKVTHAVIFFQQNGNSGYSAVNMIEIARPEQIPVKKAHNSLSQKSD